jgi:hypothetical protein
MLVVLFRGLDMPHLALEKAKPNDLNTAADLGNIAIFCFNSVLTIR